MRNCCASDEKRGIGSRYGDLTDLVPHEHSTLEAQGIHQIPAFTPHASVCSYCGSGTVASVQLKLEDVHAVFDAHAKRIEDLIAKHLTTQTGVCQQVIVAEVDAVDLLEESNKPSAGIQQAEETEEVKTAGSSPRNGEKALATSLAVSTRQGGAVAHHFVQEEMHKLKTAVEQAKKGDSEGQKKLLEKEKKTNLVILTHSRAFEMFVCANVVANMLIIALKVDIRMRDSADAVPFLLEVLDMTTSASFALELVLRILAEGWSYMSPNRKDFVWHCFDCFLVTTAIIEGVLEIIRGATGAIDLSALRLFRLGRLLRIVPAARYHRSMSDMRILVLSIVHGMRPFFWSGLMLVLVVLIASVGVMELLLVLVPEDQQGLDWNPDIAEFFGSVQLSVYTIIKCILGGIDWGDVAQPLWDESWPIGLVFTSFIAYSQLLLLNVMTGIFVRNAAETANRDEDAMMVYELDQRKKWVHQVVRIFNEAQSGSDDETAHELTRDRFIEALTQLRVQMLLLKLAIDTDAHSPESLFTLFDYNGSGTLDIHEFASALHHFHGYARSVDVAKLKCSMAALHRQLGAIEVHLTGKRTPSVPYVQPEQAAL